MGQGRVVIVLLLAAAAVACSQPPQPVASPEALPKVTASSNPPAPDRTQLAKDALALLAAKNYDAAIPALTTAAEAYPEVAPFLRLRIVEAETALSHPREALNAATAIIALGETTASTVARLRLPALYAQLGDRAATDAAWQQAMQVPIDEMTEGDIVAMATALAKAGRTDLATKTRMRLLTDYTSGRYTEQTYGFLKNELAQLPLADRLALAAKLARADRYDQALELFGTIPGSTPEARNTRLRALFNSRNYTQLLDETKDAKLDDPALMALRARAAWRVGRPEELLAGLDEIEKSYPDSKEAIDAKIVRSKYYTTDVVDYPQAIANLTKAIDAGATGTDGENIWNLGWTYTLWGKYDDALATFDRYIRTFPDGDWKTNSLFWSAKIHDRQGRTAERDAKARQIIAEYPFSYYAYRTKELWPAAAAGVPQTGSSTPFPDIEAELNKIDEPRFDTVDALLEIGLNRAAAREMKVLAAKYATNPGVQFLLADVYVRGGEPFKANSVLQRQFRQYVRHGGTNIPQRFWEILFPRAYWEAYQAEGQRQNVDPYLLASITRQESGFEPTTVSNAGAVGLMQIMPAEVSRIAEAGGLGAMTREDLFTPEKNIAVGAAEYAQKLATWNGNHVLAIASYNAGEQPVGTWIEKTPVDDMDLFVESIPYAETRLYVKTVTRNRFEYRRIYESSSSAVQQQSGTQ